LREAQLFFPFEVGKGFVMDERQRQKAWKRVLVIVSQDSRLHEMARQFFEQQPMESVRMDNPEPLSTTRPERFTWTYNFIALAVAFGSWAYTVIAPEPNFVLGGILSLLTAAMLILGLWIRLKWNWKAKAVGATLILMLFTGMFYGLRLDYTHRKLEAQQTEVSKYLKDSAQLPPSGNAWNTVFTLTNDSTLAVTASFYCSVNTLIANHGRYFIGNTGIGSKDENVKLEPNGDAEIGQCLYTVSLPIHAIDCADVKIETEYFLDTQPAVQKTKEARFVGLADGDSFSWHRGGLDHKGSYCIQPSP
jgi:hypothetical protein